MTPVNYSRFSSLISDFGEERVCGGVHLQYSINAANALGGVNAQTALTQTVPVHEPTALEAVLLCTVAAEACLQSSCRRSPRIQEIPNH
ncbi:MAG: hypothetical protein ACLP7Q_22685 [Isosphaeraceae bacterium]